MPHDNKRDKIWLLCQFYENINKHIHYYRGITLHVSSVIKSINIHQQMILRGTRDTTSSEICLLINNYIATVCKWSVLVRTALHARKDIAHCSERNNKQDHSLPQKLPRALANICFTVKGWRPTPDPRDQNQKRDHAKLTTSVFCVRHGLAKPAAYLSVDNGSHPEAFARPRNRQHGPQEYKDGKHQGYHGGRDHVVKDDHKIAHHFWPGHQRIVQGINKEQDARLTDIELLWLLQLIIMKHPVRSRVPQMNWTWTSQELLFKLLLFFPLKSIKFSC